MEYIEREAAIRAIKGDLEQYEWDCCEEYLRELPSADVVPAVRWKGADKPPEDGAYILIDSIRFGVAEARYQAGMPELGEGAIWSVCREHGEQLSDDDILGWMPLPTSNSAHRRE